MKKKTHLYCGLIGLLATAGLLIACEASRPTATPGNTLLPVPAQQSIETSIPSAPSPTATPRPMRTPIPKVAATATPASGDFDVVTPLATAPAIRFAGWSPDSRWVAYWAALQEDVENFAAYGFPTGTLHFVNVETGKSCVMPEFTDGDGDRIRWSDDGAAILFTDEGWFTGGPCQAEPYAPLADYTPEVGEHPDPALSPDGRYRAATTLLSSEGGVLTFETTLTPRDDKQPVQGVTWQIDERLGDYALMGEWISQSQFLIYETLTKGPLILDTEGGVTSVLSELFGLREVPSVLDEQGYGLRAVPAPGVEPDSFHLLLTGVGVEGNSPSVTLYHPESWLVETLPYRSVWWEPFSADHQWLLMDERPDVGGYESHAIRIRRIEDVDGEWQLLATGVDSVLWSTDWVEMAFSDESRITWQTFPDAEPIGRWDTGQFWTYPVEWSPDGRYLVTEGNVPGTWRYGLFLLERQSETASIAQPPGLVYRSADGLCGVDAAGSWVWVLSDGAASNSLLATSPYGRVGAHDQSYQRFRC